MYEASRSKKIEFDGNLRDYMAHLGISGLQQRDRDASPADVLRKISKQKSRYKLRDNRSVELLLETEPSPSSVLSYEILRIIKGRGGAELGRTRIGRATLTIATGKLHLATDDAVVRSLEDYELIHEFCGGLYGDFQNAGKRINASSAAWMARKVIESVGGRRLAGRERSSNVWYIPEAGLDIVRRYIEGLGWYFISFPVEMSKELAEALGRKTAA